MTCTVKYAQSPPIMHTQFSSTRRENASRRDVSILIPAYKPDWFAECLESALAQTWPVKEIIISDDCPTDDIRQIVSRYEADPRIRYARNAGPKGPCGNYLNLARLSDARWFKFLDDDDALLPDGLERLMHHAKGRTSVVTGACQLVDAHGDAGMMPVDSPESVNGRRHFIRCSRRPPEGLFSRMLFRADVVQSVLDEDLPQSLISLDEMLGLIAAFYGDPAYEHAPVCRYRLSPAGYSRLTTPQVLLDDMACVTVPFRMAAERKFLLPKELGEWRTGMLTQYTRRNLHKYLDSGDLAGMKEFLRLMRQRFGTGDTLRCCAASGLLRAAASRFLLRRNR